MSRTLEKPDVYCPKEGKRVPVWYCTGSFTQNRDGCPELIETRVSIVEDKAEVKCKLREESEND